MKKLPKSTRNDNGQTHKVIQEEKAEETTSEAVAYTAQIKGSRSFFFHPEPGYDVTSVISLLQTGQAIVKSDFALRGDEEIAWLEVKEDQFEYSGFLALSPEATATPVLCLHDPGRETATVENRPSETQTQAITLEFDPHFD